MINLSNYFREYWGKLINIPPRLSSSDVFIISYPKSGNTWFRYMLANYLWMNVSNLDFKELASYIPHLTDYKELSDKNSDCNKLKNRFIKAHFPYNSKAKKIVNNAIYIVRDGRDALLSYWYFCNQRDNTFIPLDEFIEISSKGNKYPYGSWGNHVDSWLNANISRKLIIKYEDMISDPHKELKKTLNFLGYDKDNNKINYAVESSSFGSLKKIQETKGLNIKNLKNVNFFRKGKVNSYLDEFTEKELQLFNKFHSSNQSKEFLQFNNLSKKP
jgi:hypothetical protein